MYVDMIQAKQLPTMGNEMRDKIASIKKQLDNKLKINKNLKDIYENNGN
jgi:hypothetical protein